MNDSMEVDFEEVELTAVNDLLERTQQRLLEEIAKKTEQYLRQSIEATDWDEVAVLDVVERMMALSEVSRPSDDEEQFMPSPTSFTVHRYPTPHVAPDKRNVYHGYVGHGLRVYRITEQVCHEIGVDPETGCDDSTTSESSLSRTTVRDCDVDD